MKPGKNRLPIKGSSNNKKPSNTVRSILSLILLALVVTALVGGSLNKNKLGKDAEVPFSTLVDEVNQSKIKKVEDYGEQYEYGYP